jgi:hypothetical protein
MMIDAYLLFLSNKGLFDTSAEKITQAVGKLSTKKLVDLIFDSEEFLSLPEPKVASPYDFYVNGSMAGGRSPCSDMLCRASRLHETAAFAALYADCVWIPSPIGSVADRHSSNLDFLRGELLTAILFLTQLRPLLQQGIVRLAPRRSAHYCVNCYSAAVNMSPKTYLRRFKESEEFLAKSLSEKVQYEAYKSKGHYTVTAVGNDLENFLGDGHFAHYIFPPKGEHDWASLGLKRTPRSLSASEVKEMGVAELYSYGILFDVFHQNVFASQYGASYLTSRPIDLMLINRVNPVKSKVANKRVTGGLSHNVPVGTDLQLSEVLRLRESERGHFLQYRSAVSKAIDEVKASTLNNTKEVFFDVIQPEITRLDLLMSEARRASKNNLIKDLVAPSAFLGLGLFSGIVSPTIAAVATAVGGLHFADKLAGHAKDLATTPKEVRQDKFYWLWKVNKAAK